MTRPNWKKHLLRSSVPLEYEAARLLVDRGLSVSANYAYARHEGGEEKEYSVDLRGVHVVRLGERVTSFCSLDLLVECKYRERGTTWLFLPQPGGSLASLSDVVHHVDYLSSKFVRGPLRDDLRFAQCLTGVEVRSSDAAPDTTSAANRATESQLRHGLRQLQYAMPAIIGLRARSVAYRELSDNLPFFLVPILLTNAELVVASTSFGVSSVEDADCPADLGQTTSCLLWAADLGPDFDQHCQRQLSILGKVTSTAQMKAVESQRQAAGESWSVLPSILAARVAADGADAMEFADFRNVLVVNIAAFAQIVDAIYKLFENACRSLEDAPLVRWSEDGTPIFPWSKTETA